MSIKNTKRNARSIYQIKYVTCAKVLQDLKGNQIMKSGQLIEHPEANIFL